LLLSICPRFPARTIDNQYHLQALRHFYVLACENRVLYTIDVDTGFFYIFFYYFYLFFIEKRKKQK
jgi:hypothetical protein